MGLTALGLAVALAGCARATTFGDSGRPDVITVAGTTCGTGWRHPAAGQQNLQVRNATTAAIEVTLISATDGAVFGRLEAVGPGTTRTLPVDLGSGVYALACDGNGFGSHIGPAVRIPGHARGQVGVIQASSGETISATQQEDAYVTVGLATLAGQTAALAADIKVGNLTEARTAWLAGHLTFERLGSAYGMFGDYDGVIDGTPLGLPGGFASPDFTGFYRIEYGLWHGQSASQLAGPAEDLATSVRELRTAWPGMQLQPPFALSDLALRTHEVLENATQFQLSGQDNFGSGTNLATVAAGIDATRRQLQILHRLLVTRYQDLPALLSSLSQLQRLVDAQDTARGWTPVSQLTAAQREQLDAAAGQAVEMLAGIPPLFEAKPMP